MGMRAPSRRNNTNRCTGLENKTMNSKKNEATKIA
jgi:hypothetical protein